MARRLIKVLKFLVALGAALTTLLWLEPVALGLAGVWLSKTIGVRNPYLHVIISAAIMCLLSLVIGIAAEVIVVLAALAYMDLLNEWVLCIHRRLGQEWTYFPLLCSVQ